MHVTQCRDLYGAVSPEDILHGRLPLESQYTGEMAPLHDFLRDLGQTVDVAPLLATV